jgi:DNA (cytosine-5)-methyltransferase 1
MKAKQLSLFDTIFIDEFAGGGGASTGIEMATGRPVNIAINHDESAIMMHKRNHPYTRHYQEDIWGVDPLTATQGRPVRLIWFSPDCKHFSKAKGASLVDKKIRGLAWVVLRWASAVKPDVIMLENVEEFTTWGPVRKGKPIKKKAGQTYRKWYKQLSDLGYQIDTRILCAADYGAPTIRKRFYLIARRDGQPIVFPERTHAPRGSINVKSGKCKPWRSAAEIIDFALPTYSIFESKEQIKEKYGARVQRPLKPNTLRRIAKGTDAFVIKSAEPFIVPIGYGERSGQNPRVHDMQEPMPTVVSSSKHYLVSPSLIQYHTEQSNKEIRGQGLTEPLRTVDASNRYGLAAVHLTQYFSGEGHYHSVDDPLATITTMEREGVVAAHLTEWYGNPRPRKH